MTALRGPGAPFTTAAECMALSAADMADFHEVIHTVDAGWDASLPASFAVQWVSCRGDEVAFWCDVSLARTVYDNGYAV